jgi:hypothetical protein
MTDTVAATPSLGMSSPSEPPQGAQQELARHLASVRERLTQDFDARLDHATVEREFDRVTAQFSDAKIKAYVPVLVNRQVRLSLRELTRAS